MGAMATDRAEQPVLSVVVPVRGQQVAVAGEPRVVQRADGSWLVDGSMAVDEFWELLQLPERRDERRGE